LVIALASVIGGLIILAILSCCWSRYRRRNRIRMRQHLPPPPGWTGAPTYMAAAPNPAMRGANGSGGMSSGWENGRWKPGAPPPVWQPSVRYA
jgi:hypothetical protein